MAILPWLTTAITRRQLLAKSAAIAVVSRLFAVLPSGTLQLPSANPSSASQSFSVELDDAYARFDGEGLTWVIGNARLEESLRLTAKGTLEEVSLVDRAGEQLWNLSDTAVQVQLVGGNQQEGTAVDLSTTLSLVDTTAAPTMDGALQMEIRLSHASAGQDLILEMRVRPGHPALERHVVLENRSPQAVRVSHLQSLAMGIATSPAASWEATAVTTKGTLKVTKLEPDKAASEATPPASGAPERHVPFMVLRDTVSGRGFFVGFRWSTDWRISARLTGSQVIQLRSGLRLDETAEHSLVVAPGSVLEAPWTFAGLFTGDLDDAARAIDRYTSATSPGRPAWALLPPVTWNSWFAYLREVDEQGLRSEADLAAQLGVEVFYVDYGWSPDLGDWQSDPIRFPNGMAGLADYVHSKGMRFGVWVAFGDAAPDSVLVEQHPEFLAQQPEPVATGIDQARVLCLTRAEDWLVERLDSLVKDYQLDWLKFDQPMIAACKATDHGHEPSLSGSLYANNLAFYRALQKVGYAQPDLWIENCFNGDGYLDYGTQRYTEATWLTDDSGQSSVAMPRIQHDFYATSYAVRPDYLIQWLAVLPGAPAAIGRSTSARDLTYQAYSSMVGAWGLSLRLTEMDQEQLSLLGRFIDQYKAVRGFIAQGDFYHLVGPSDLGNPWGGGWMVLQYYQPETGQGAILYVRNGEDTPPQISVQLRGLDPQSSYRIWLLDDVSAVQEYRGQELLEIGLPLTAEPRQGSWLLLATTGG